MAQRAQRAQRTQRTQRVKSFTRSASGIKGSACPCSSACGPEAVGVQVAVTRRRPGVLTVQERQARIAANPLRADGIASGRRRLAATSDHLNPGVRTLQALRLAAGLSQKELAQRMDVLQSNIALLEQNPGLATLSTIRKLSWALNVSVADVVGAIELTSSTACERA